MNDWLYRLSTPLSHITRLGRRALPCPTLSPAWQRLEDERSMQPAAVHARRVILVLRIRPSVLPACILCPDGQASECMHVAIMKSCAVL